MRTAQDIMRWAIVVQFETRRQARMLKMTLREVEGNDLTIYGVLYGPDCVRVVRLRPAACSTPSGKSRVAVMTGPSAMGGGLLARISAAVRRFWMAAGRLLTTRNSPTTGRRQRRSCSGTGRGTGR